MHCNPELMVGRVHPWGKEARQRAAAPSAPAQLTAVGEGFVLATALDAAIYNCPSVIFDARDVANVAYL